MDSSQVSAVQWAYNGGMLEIASMLLGLVSIILVVAGVFAFMNLRGYAQNAAREATKEAVESIAERVANEYIQRELPKIIHEYREFGYGVPGDDEADDIAQAQDNGGPNEVVR